jgi:hypothetical protein
MWASPPGSTFGTRGSAQKPRNHTPATKTVNKNLVWLKGRARWGNYLRTPGDDGRDKGGLPVQREACTAFAEKTARAIAAAFVDDGVTGKLLMYARPQGKLSHRCAARGSRQDSPLLRREKDRPYPARLLVLHRTVSRQPGLRSLMPAGQTSVSQSWAASTACWPRWTGTPPSPGCRPARNTGAAQSESRGVGPMVSIPHTTTTRSTLW